MLDVRVHDLRDWTFDRHRTVDDTPYGGGPGMVMKPEPWGAALDSVLGLEGMLAVHGAILAGMPPQQLIGGLAVMFPAMNVDDRVDVLAGMRATAPSGAQARPG